ncbi:DUF4876 domain-containing protein [Flammeovirgaceae bacterium SG7u.111]|nr:DUF4876 domain-containing protein [Flammeovirgaceae bacterium SG7u.132]WPO36562.1 DUF4876 domain-containing protein [Flammeovirgaceae bacterium SG7u.111]
MKKVTLISFIASLLLVTSCHEEDFITPVSHTVAVTFDEAYGSLTSEAAELTLNNLEDGKTYTATTDVSGMAIVQIVPGTYNITATLQMTAEEYETFSGQKVDTDVAFNASLSNVVINEASNENSELVLVTGRIGNIIFKQIYYTGSDTKLGASYRDQFFEVYNNSNEIIYLDGLCFAQIKGTTSTPSTLKDYHQSNGQYDWSQSIGQAKGSSSNTDYIYADEVLRIPGTGEQYPLAPGEGAIVAGTAVNHKAPLTAVDSKGETVTYEVPEPDRTIDLSNAPFEAYYREYQEAQGKKYLASDIDNPNAVNLDIVFKSFTGQDLILDPNGRDAFALFYADNDLLNSWDALPLPSVSADKYTETTVTFLQIPNSVVIDAVEVQYVDPAKNKPKRLADVLDAGEIASIQGRYSSESVIRKVSNTIGDRVIYVDTNNSSEDFEVLSHPQVTNE